MGFLALTAFVLAGCGAGTDSSQASGGAEPTVAIAPVGSIIAEADPTTIVPTRGTVTPAPVSPSEPVPGARVDQPPPLTESAVVGAHTAYLAAFHDSMDPPDPNHPGLAAWATGPQLETARHIRRTQAERGWLAQGTYASSPELAAVSEDEATVLDCYQEDMTVLDARGLVVQTVEPGTYLLESILVPEGGTWKVSLFLSERTPCTVD